ncbi:hypothetical protein Lxx02070 [Leifsonia xyli subsp. xyli str. CTCB07]|uniref:GtrA/DPMS transmembrane domain-containing protein n=1 Tax=Leifsonia xyli subsp. xyli (strain CTCB07) TaxID=281090 RepID=Q6AH82_LEIXX|nr:hypothetical protein Lxx02070 [Leifsonia xyli subsp. xyli str. CTCB07]
MRFLSTTVAGVTVDVGGYAALTAAGVAAGPANLVSASSSVFVVYLLSRGMVFPGRHTVAGLIAFFGWYGFSIALFSLLLQGGVDAFALAPLAAKLISLPFSFAVNFFAVRAIFAVVDRLATRKEPTIP